MAIFLLIFHGICKIGINWVDIPYMDSMGGQGKAIVFLIDFFAIFFALIKGRSRRTTFHVYRERRDFCRIYMGALGSGII